MLALLLLPACAPCDDLCGHDALVAAPTFDEALTLAPAVADSILRDAAILEWMKLHRGELSATQVETMCGEMSLGEAGFCLRRASAAHLLR